MEYTTGKQSVLFPNAIQNTLGLSRAALVSKDNSIPKAYINSRFFDKDNNFKSGMYRQVSEEALRSSRSEFGKELATNLSPQISRNKLN